MNNLKIHDGIRRPIRNRVTEPLAPLTNKEKEYLLDNTLKKVINAYRNRILRSSLLGNFEEVEDLNSEAVLFFYSMLGKFDKNNCGPISEKDESHFGEARTLSFYFLNYCYGRINFVAAEARDTRRRTGGTFGILNSNEQELNQEVYKYFLEKSIDKNQEFHSRMEIDSVNEFLSPWMSELPKKSEILKILNGQKNYLSFMLEDFNEKFKDDILKELEDKYKIKGKIRKEILKQFGKGNLWWYRGLEVMSQLKISTDNQIKAINKLNSDILIILEYIETLKILKNYEDNRLITILSNIQKEDVKGIHRIIQSMDRIFSRSNIEYEGFEDYLKKERIDYPNKPKNFSDIHDWLILVCNNLELNISDMLLVQAKFKENLYKDFTLEIPETVVQLSTIGNKMSNCVASYVGRINDERSLIIAAKNQKGKYELCIDYSLNNRRIKEIKGPYNSTVDRTTKLQIQNFLEENLELIP